MKKETWGFHLSLDLFNCNREKITNKKILEKYLIDVAANIKMKRWGWPQVNRFGEGDLEGFSGFQFIVESSIQFHCNEQNGHSDVYIDIFSCKEFDVQSAIIFSVEFFEAKEVDQYYRER